MPWVHGDHIASTTSGQDQYQLTLDSKLYMPRK